jgi:predicted enzyme related to lactoylglutathione lyase
MEMTAYENGAPCWVDLMTTDRGKAIAFYTGLFGWTEGEDAGPDMHHYTQFLLGGKTVAAVVDMVADSAAGGMTSTWTTYLAVDDLDVVAAKVVPAGGTVAMPPMVVAEAGRMAMVADPSGALVGLYQAGEHIGAELIYEAGTMGWNELATRDPEKALIFFNDVLGWTDQPKPMGSVSYHEIQNNGRTVAGCMPMEGDRWPADAASHWMVYFVVDDTDATATKATELGGVVNEVPADNPYGRVAVLSDPTGGVFSVITMASS